VNRRYKRWFLWLDVLGGVLSINLAFAAAATLRFEDLSVQNPTYYNYYVQLIVFFNLLWLLLRLLRGEGEWQQKDPGVRRKVSRNLSLVIAHLFAFGILALALKDQATYFSRLFGLYFYTALLTLLTAWSFVLHGFEMRLAKKGVGRRRVALVGDVELLNGLLPHLESLRLGGFDVVGIYCSQQLDPKFSCKHPEELVEELARGDLEELFIATEDQSQLLSWEREADRASVRVRLLPRIDIPGERSYQLEYVGHVPLFFPRPEPLELVHNRVVKRFFDLFLTILALLILLPFLFPVLALLVRISGPGPVFFRQERSGLRNETFLIWKFRSMDGAGNISVIGRIMRKYSLDELPQLFNVLSGEMSLVGPRPHMLEHTEEYRDRMDAFMLRHLIQPGLTGMAQVQGNRGSIESQDELSARVSADVYYMENWNLLLDLKIVLLTFFQLFSPSVKAR